MLKRVPLYIQILIGLGLGVTYGAFVSVFTKGDNDLWTSFNDFTYNWIGTQRLPSHTELVDFKGNSPSYSLVNSQITRVLSNKFDVYIGGENIGGYTQSNPIIGGDDPFGADFDTSLIYAPIHGALIYVGLRFNN